MNTLSETFDEYNDSDEVAEDGEGVGFEDEDEIAELDDSDTGSSEKKRLKNTTGSKSTSNKARAH
jgi:hypothetical protein